MENNKLAYAPVRSRILALLIDSFIVYILRILCMQIFSVLFLENNQESLFLEYNSLIKKITEGDSVTLQILLQSSFFRVFGSLVVLLFLVAVIYNIICFSTKMSASVGQKVLGLKVVSANGQKMNIWQILSRSLLIVLPWFLLFLILFSIMFGLISLNNEFDKNLVVIYVILFMTWYDMIFFTKEKIIFYDLATKTRVIIKNPDTYYESKSMKVINFIIPDFKEMFLNMKNVVKSHINDIKNIFKNDVDSVKEELKKQDEEQKQKEDEIKKEEFKEFEEVKNEKKSKKSSTSRSSSKTTKTKQSKTKKEKQEEEKETKKADAESKKTNKNKTKKTTKKVVKKKTKK